MTENDETAQSGKKVIGLFLIVFLIVAALVLGAGFLPWKEWRRQSNPALSPGNTPTQPTPVNSSESP